jgi:hypothetical protein
VSLADEEPLAATASRVDHWILVEYRGLWNSRPLPASGLSDQVKNHLRRQVAELPRSKLLFIRRPERRRHPGVKLFFAASTEGDSRLYAAELADYQELVDVPVADVLLGRASFEAPAEHPLLLVCTHGKHDPCCAKYGRPLYEALREGTDEEWVWQSSHVGGDRFAGNLVCLPAGLYFGRLTASAAWDALDEVLAGRIPLESYRGRSCYPFAVQAAELEVRRATGLRDVEALRLVDGERTPDGGARVRFNVPSGEVQEVDVELELGPLTHLTCSAAELRRPRRYAAKAHRVLASR